MIHLKQLRDALAGVDWPQMLKDDPDALLEMLTHSGGVRVAELCLYWLDVFTNFKCHSIEDPRQRSADRPVECAHCSFITVPYPGPKKNARFYCPVCVDPEGTLARKYTSAVHLVQPLCRLAPEALALADLEPPRQVISKQEVKAAVKRKLTEIVEDRGRLLKKLQGEKVLFEQQQLRELSLHEARWTKKVYQLKAVLAGLQ